MCWAGRRLAEAERFFQEALQAQEALIAEFPDLPSHNRVLLEFLRWRLGQLAYERHALRHDPQALATAAELLRTCTGRLAELTQRPELAKDRLARSTLPLAYETLSRALADLGEGPKADEAFHERAPHPEGCHTPTPRVLRRPGEPAGKTRGRPRSAGSARGKLTFAATHQPLVNSRNPPARPGDGQVLRWRCVGPQP